MIWTREFTDQVFDTAGSVQVGLLGQACGGFLMTGPEGLHGLFFVGGLVRTKWRVWGRRPGCMLKGVNTTTKTPTPLLARSQTHNRLVVGDLTGSMSRIHSYDLCVLQIIVGKTAEC